MNDNVIKFPGRSLTPAEWLREIADEVEKLTDETDIQMSIGFKSTANPTGFEQMTRTWQRSYATDRVGAVGILMAAVHDILAIR